MSCGCGRPKPCSDGACPHAKRPLTTKLIPFALWAQSYTPVIPKFYWDVFSPEEGILNLVRELDRLRAYINYMFCEVEKLAQELDEALQEAEKLADKLAQKLAEAEQLLTELRETLEIVNKKIIDLTTKVNAAQKTADEAKQAAATADTKAGNAQKTANEAKQAAATADTKAGNAQQAAKTAQTAAQSAQAAAQQATQSLTSLNNRVAALEECCNTAKQRLSSLEEWKKDVNKQLKALNVITAENPNISLSNFECSGQTSSGPLGAGISKYCSVLAAEVPLNINASGVTVNTLSASVRIGGNLSFKKTNGTLQPISALTLIENGQPAFSEIIDWYAVITRSGIRVRIQFSEPLWVSGKNPDGQYFEKKMQNGTPCAVAIWMDAKAN